MIVFVLEKQIGEDKWRRYAECNRRWPLDRVLKGLRESGTWRVVYAADSPLWQSGRRKAA